MYEKYNARRFFFGSYILAAVSASLILINNDEDSQYYEMVMSFIARFAISCTYQGIYLSNNLFPIVFASTTFGVCNFFAGLAGLFSFEVLLKLDDSLAISLFIVFSIAGSIVAIFLKE